MLVIGALRPSLLPGLTYHAAHSECLRAAGLRCGSILRLTLESRFCSWHLSDLSTEAGAGPVSALFRKPFTRCLMPANDPKRTLSF